MRTVNANEARTNWRDVLDTVVAGKSVVVERHGKPVAAVIPFDVYEALAEQIEDLEDERAADVALAEYLRDPSGAMALEELDAELEEMEVSEGKSRNA